MITLIASVITIGQCGAGLWERQESANREEDSMPPVQVAREAPARTVPSTPTPTPTVGAASDTSWSWPPINPSSEESKPAGEDLAPTFGVLFSTLAGTPRPNPTASPTPVPPLGEQLRVALSIDDLERRARTLFEVTKHAVIIEDYWTAIRAVDESLEASVRDDILRFIVYCAKEEGKYDMASEAASRIENSHRRDFMLEMIVKDRRVWPSGKGLRYENGRQEMVCFRVHSDLPNQW